MGKGNGQWAMGLSTCFIMLVSTALHCTALHCHSTMQKYKVAARSCDKGGARKSKKADVWCCSPNRLCLPIFKAVLAVVDWKRQTIQTFGLYAAVPITHMPIRLHGKLMLPLQGQVMSQDCTLTRSCQHQ